MQVELLDADDAACRDFVLKSPQGRICHLPSWTRMVCRVGGYGPCYLVARDGPAVVGVMPMAQVRSWLFGNRMISMAFSNYGGAISTTLAATEALYHKAVELAEEAGCRSIEFRGLAALPFDLPQREGKLCMYLPLDADPERVWKRFDPKVRNQVRKAEKSGLIAADGGAELLDDFYRIYTVRMRELGTPCYSRRIMQAILKTYPDNSRIFIVRQDRPAIGAGLITWFNGLVEIPWAATLVKYNPLCPNNLLYWSAIRHACLVGATHFDFGRCTADGPTYRFKKRWGADPVPLYYQFWVRPGQSLFKSDPDDPRYRRKVELWKRLPLWITLLLGPRISRGLC
jgi:serine/alanine adding enzyme